jgi:hypothetical protein
MNLQRASVVLIWAFLSGCTSVFPSDTFDPSKTPTTVFVGAPNSSEVTTEPISTNTRLPAQIITPFPTPTKLVTKVLVDSRKIDQLGNEGNNLSGCIFLKGAALGFLSQYPSYILNLMDFSKDNIMINSDERIEFFSISPDHKNLAITIASTPIDSDVLRIINSNGEEILRIDYSDKDWFSLIGWFDENHLLFSRNMRSKDNELKIPGPIVVFNPFNQKIIQELSISNFPEAATWVPFISESPWAEYSEAMASYSPDLKYVIYLNDTMEIILRDVELQTTILNLDSGWFAGPPRWRSDSQSFIIDRYLDEDNYRKEIFDEELFQIDIAGTVKRLSTFTDTFNGVRIDDFTLSPDQKLVAFWINTDGESPQKNLAVFQIETNILTIFENISLPIYENGYPPVWSPDNSQIMVVFIESGQNETVFSTLLVDLKEPTATLLAHDVIPGGWMQECD